MILDGTTPYLAYDMTRLYGLVAALIMTIIVETLIISYADRKFPKKDLSNWILLIGFANVVTFMLGLVMFVVVEV